MFVFRKSMEQGRDTWLPFDVNIKSTDSLVLKSSSLHCEMGEIGEASLGYFTSIPEALIINTESEKVQIYFIGLSKKWKKYKYNVIIS